MAKSKKPTPARGWASLCVECGPNVMVDEDGCCSGCGATAWGRWLDSPRARRIVRDANALPAAVEALESVRTLGVECFTDGSTVAPRPACTCNTCATMREVAAALALAGVKP